MKFILKSQQQLSDQNHSKFREHNCCVIIPTYNNARTLRRVIDGVLLNCDKVIVVNDGSTDDTPLILQSYVEKTVLVEHEKNRGKGLALRNGFRKAIALGFNYAITIDSDGQHYPENLMDLLNESISHPEAVILGSRNMDQKGVPGKSSFGNKFSNFWFYIETGLKMPDTQTGFRLYPLGAIQKKKYFTRKFEFEIEVIVKLAWMYVEFRAVPVKVLYDPEERVSHFRPFRDFVRISFLNTYLVTLTLLYHLPVRIIKKIWEKGLWQTFQEQLSNKNESNIKKAIAIGFGIFMGIVPIWGFQMIVAGVLAKLLRLNVVLTLMASNISIPIMIPFILYASYWTGGVALNESAAVIWDSKLSLAGIYTNLRQYVVGAMVFATVSGLMMFVLSLGILKIVRKEKITHHNNEVYN